MRRKNTIGGRKIQIEVRDARTASVYAGQVAIVALMRQKRLIAQLQNCAALDSRVRERGYEGWIYALAIILSLTNGGGCIAAAERLNEDKALLEVLGIERFPDQSSIAEWLRKDSANKSLAILSILREFVGSILKDPEFKRRQGGAAIEIFFDDTQIEVFGKKFESAKINYEGNVALSWQTLHVNGFLVDGQLGPPPANKEAPESAQAGKDVSALLPQMLTNNVQLWKDALHHFFADSASSAGKYLNSIGEHCKSWTVSYNKWTSPLERLAAELPETQWSTPQTIRWRDGQEHTAQYAFGRHQPGGCDKPQLYAICRHKSIVQTEMFWRYHFVVCNETQETTTPQSIFERHNLKGDQERTFEDILNSFDLHHPPCHDLAANNLYYTLGMLAWNILHAMRCICLPPEQTPMKVRTLIQRLLLVPMIIRKHSGKIKATLFALATSLPFWKQFFRTFAPHYAQPPPKPLPA